MQLLCSALRDTIFACTIIFVTKKSGLKATFTKNSNSVIACLCALRRILRVQ